MTRYLDYVKEKDVQMLAMLSMLVLQTELGAPSIRVKNTTPSVDYFSLKKSAVNLLSPLSPEWPRLPSSPVAPSIAPSFSSSNSTRGSWSSLFNTGTMRQFMNGVQDSLKEGLSTPSEIVPSHGISIAGTRSDEKLEPTGFELGVGGLSKRRVIQESLLHVQVPTGISKSWNDDARPSKLTGVSFSSAGHRRLRFTDSSSFINENQVVIFEPDSSEDS
jgi:WD repeat-containing protein 59